MFQTTITPVEDIFFLFFFFICLFVTIGEHVNSEQPRATHVGQTYTCGQHMNNSYTYYISIACLQTYSERHMASFVSSFQLCTHRKRIAGEPSKPSRQINI